ncbi:sugar transferase [Celeribacter sp.]|uniref:sugar transferase n=1 Tax=Celeribacter sp. TaxID=1890673 RepID=UPI003A944DC6
MKLVITGASGFLAGELIPFLRNNGHDLVLVSGRFGVLSEKYPDLVCVDYADFDNHLVDAACVLHLAVRHNDRQGDLSAFREINVDLTLSVLEAAKSAGVKKFIFASSLHTLGLSPPRSDYARSKAEAEELVLNETGIDVSVLHMAAVHGSRFRGKLAVLNKCPKILLKPALTCLGALRPTVHVEKVADRIEEILCNDRCGPHYLHDNLQDNPVFVWTKRTIDLLFALFVFVFLGWLMLLVWVAIKLDSPGPGFFIQERVGRNGKTFNCYKFRTMAQGTTQAGTHEVSAASITKIGKILRSTKIDELPQILNIARNEISLIGPRPCLPSQAELVAKRRQLGVFDVKPGISGLAQIRDIDMSTPDRLVQVDAQYVALQCLSLDVKIALATAKGSGQGDKVVRD